MANANENTIVTKNFVVIHDQLFEVDNDGNDLHQFPLEELNIVTIENNKEQSEISEISINNSHYHNEEYEDVEYLDEEENTTTESVSRPRLTRKRQKNTVEWKANKRKKLRQAGEAYISARNKLVPAKTLKPINCLEKKCKSSCRLISEEDRTQIFSEFYKTDSEGKTNYILMCTEKNLPLRQKRTSTKKKFTYQYFFVVRGSRLRVCKNFFLRTLAVSQKTVYNAHTRKESISGVPRKSKQGKHTKTSIPESAKEIIRGHIKSFPTISSHYCRISSSKQYLEPHLTIRQMYNLYKEQRETEGTVPEKEHKYRQIFNTEFNYAFHTPKKDRCDLCEEHKVSNASGSASMQLKAKYDHHIEQKSFARTKRENDRQTTVPVVCFDLQNVVTCPKAEISCFYYLSKLNIYNLTAHLSTDNSVYCSIWNESQTGRAGNDIASALNKILEAILRRNPTFTELILWSDSCVPQNRNSIISFALINFLKIHPSISKITMKFSTPGHSCIQEIDNVHSCLDRVFRNREFFSPVSFMRILTKIKYKGKLCNILQMRQEDFQNFKECSSILNFKQVPFAKVVQMEFVQSLTTMKYKISHNPVEAYISVSLKNTQLPRRSKKIGQSLFSELPVPESYKFKTELPIQKLKSFKTMLKFMPTVDREFFQHLIADKSGQDIL